MNLLLHGIGGKSDADMPLNNGLPVTTKDALAGKHGEYDINPPFGKKSEWFKSFTQDGLLKRDKVNLEIFWLKDEALEESANLPPPEIIAQEIREDLEAALEQFATIAEDLKEAKQTCRHPRTSAPPRAGLTAIQPASENRLSAAKPQAGES